MRETTMSNAIATTTDPTMYFFDSHGGLWVVCDAEHPEAQAFGPRGCARPVDAGPLCKPEETALSAARRFSLVETCGEWDALA
jgi:hypothetical protein